MNGVFEYPAVLGFVPANQDGKGFVVPEVPAKQGRQRQQLARSPAASRARKVTATYRKSSPCKESSESKGVRKVQHAAEVDDDMSIGQPRPQKRRKSTSHEDSALEPRPNENSISSFALPAETGERLAAFRCSPSDQDLSRNQRSFRGHLGMIHHSQNHVAAESTFEPSKPLAGGSGGPDRDSGSHNVDYSGHTGNPQPPLELEQSHKVIGATHGETGPGSRSEHFTTQQRYHSAFLDEDPAYSNEDVDSLFFPMSNQELGPNKHEISSDIDPSHARAVSFVDPFSSLTVGRETPDSQRRRSPMDEPDGSSAEPGLDENYYLSGAPEAAYDVDEIDVHALASVMDFEPDIEFPVPQSSTDRNYNAGNGKSSLNNVPADTRALDVSNFPLSPVPSSFPADDPSEAGDPGTNSIAKDEDFLGDEDEEIADLFNLTDQLSRSSPVPPNASSLETAKPRRKPSSFYVKEMTVPSPIKPKKAMPSSPSSDNPRIDNQPWALWSQRAKLPTPTKLSYDANNNPIPFLGPKVPKPVRDRSPIPGLSPTKRLQTCFRLGEALNVASRALRAFTPTLIELYARVVRSERKLAIQHFTFADLFYADRPPYLEGSWEGWQGSRCWEADGVPFLGGPSGKVCRVVGRLERGVDGKLSMNVISLWEAGWDDVESVMAVVCA